MRYEASLDPKELVLDLLVVRHPIPCSIKELLQAARLFDITDNSLRVTVTRLVAQGALSNQGRGLYVPGPKTRDLTQEIRAWRTASKRMCSWSGHYIMVVFRDDKKFKDRTQQQLRVRVLGLSGFQPLTPSVAFRPANLREGLADMQQRLQSLGLTDFFLSLVQQVSGIELEEIKRFWPIEELNGTYAILAASLKEWLQKANTLALPQAARECFVMGRHAIRHVNRDPLLPDAWIDAALRQEFFACAELYDKFGQHIWKQLFAWAELINPL